MNAPDARDEVPRDPEVTEAFQPDELASELVRVLDAYMAELQAGARPDREKLLREHPSLAGQLEQCLASIEFIHGAARPSGGTPAQLGDFRIVREIGRGGMGVVYEAEQVSLRRKVALKVLRFGGATDPEAMRRFQDEALMIARLHHTNIVPIFAVGCEEGVHYYAMQFIDGRGLDAVLQESRQSDQPLAPQDVARWGLQAADALDHAHQRSVIHRDIKPSNLLLDSEGTLWLTDFGLAKREDDITQTVAGVLMGTPRYMSPEQAAAMKQPVDHRTDIYSLGATLYELATGKPMFDADTPHGVIAQILTAEPPPPRQVRADLPRDLETIILKCLAKEPAQRYATAQALADDLRAFTEGRAIKARRASLAEQAVRWLRRQKKSVALTAAAVAATLIVVLGGLWGSYGYSRSRLGYLMLTTDTPPLVAEVLDEHGEPVAPPDTLPMQQPLELPAREYQVRVMGDAQLSRTMTTTVTRGKRFEYTVGLADQRLRPIVEVQRAFRVVQFDDGAGLILMDNKGIRCVDAARDRERWALDLSEPAKLPQPATGLVWPWDKLAASSAASCYDRFDLLPFAVSRAVDLNGDGHRDLVLAGQHQAWLMAISGTDGKPLWVAARAPELRQVADAQTQHWVSSQGVQSAVLASPEVVGDLDGDGTSDLLATFVDRRPREPSQPGQTGPQRWVESMSGATGKPLWRFDLDPQWFDLPQGTNAPYAFQWFEGRGGGSSSSGGSRRRGHKFVRSGSHVYAPDPARVVQTRDGRAIVLAVGRHLVALDPRTGKPLWPADDSGMRPGLGVIWADMDGDGWPDAVLVEEPAPRPGGPGGGLPPPFPVAVFSLVKHALLWKKELTAFWPHQPEQVVSAPRWPVVADLDGDGACELIAPNGTSDDNVWHTDKREWGDLEVLDGATGQSRWKRRLMTLDEQIDHFAVGPDLDGDGVREVFAAVLWGPAPDLRRYRGRQKRDVAREVSLEQSLAESSGRLGSLLAASGTSPSQQAARHEQEVLLAAALARLPDDYREVVILRNLEGLSHEEVARRMDRSAGAVRMLWVRALTRLREELDRRRE